MKGGGERHRGDAGLARSVLEVVQSALGEAHQTRMRGISSTSAGASDPSTPPTSTQQMQTLSAKSHGTAPTGAKIAGALHFYFLSGGLPYSAVGVSPTMSPPPADDSCPRSFVSRVMYAFETVLTGERKGSRRLISTITEAQEADDGEQRRATHRPEAGHVRERREDGLMSIADRPQFKPDSRLTSMYRSMHTVTHPWTARTKEERSRSA